MKKQNEEFLKNFIQIQKQLENGEIELEDILASGEKLEQLGEISDDFINRIILPFLGAPWVFVSDGTNIYDFCSDEEDETRLLNMIIQEYGVDVSFIKDGNLADIILYILMSKQH